MSRGIGTSNEAAVNADHVHEVMLVKLEFDTPVYAHSGIGSITYDGNTYLGVGSFGSIDALRESRIIGPSQITLSLDGTDSDYVAEVLNAGNYGDVVTIYEGVRQDDGTLIAQPWVAWKGTLEYASLKDGEQSIASITCQHDLAILDEKDGRRYSTEDHQGTYPADLGFQFAASSISKKLLWGGGGVGGGPSYRDGTDPPARIER